MIEALKGFKTIILGWVPLVVLLFAKFGIDIPEFELNALINEAEKYSIEIVAVYGALITWARGLPEQVKNIFKR